MPKQPTTKVVPTSKVEAGRRSAAGRARDERGRLLPRNPAPEPAPPTPGEPPPATPPAEPAPRFSQVRRRWSPIVGRRRTKQEDPDT